MLDAPPPLNSQTSSQIVARLRASGCVLAEEEARLLLAAAGSPGHLDEGQLEHLVGQRIAGEPLEHVLGWAEFCGLRIAVGPGVFVPRRRTELLVQVAAERLRQDPRRVVADLCCGSGAIAAALAVQLRERPGSLNLWATDLDPVAVSYSRYNLRAAATVLEGDLYDPLPPDLRGTVTAVVANAPFVPTASIGLLPPEARVHEPQLALDGGADGLDVLRQVIERAPDWLAPGGHVVVQGSERQAPQIARAMAGSGLSAQVITSAELEATVVAGTRT